MRHLGTMLCLGLMLCLTTAAVAQGVSVLSDLTQSMTLGPGGTVEGRILLQNRSPKASEVRVYQTDYLFRASGDTSYGDPGTVQRSNAAWLTLTPRQLTVPAGETALIYYTVTVPQDQALSGTYWSMVMVEPVAPALLPDPDKTKPQVALRTILRYGIQMVTNIQDTGARELRFADKRLVVEEAARFLQIDVENTGQCWLSPLLWAELYDKAGASVGRFEARRQRLYPGCSGRFRIDLSRVPAGTYSAVVVADNGDEYVFGARYALDIK